MQLAAQRGGSFLIYGVETLHFLILGIRGFQGVPKQVKGGEAVHLTLDCAGAACKFVLEEMERETPALSGLECVWAHRPGRNFRIRHFGFLPFGRLDNIGRCVGEGGN